MLENSIEWMKNNSTNLTAIVCFLVVLLIVYGTLYNMSDLMPNLPPPESENFNQ